MSRPNRWRGAVSSRKQARRTSRERLGRKSKRRSHSLQAARRREEPSEKQRRRRLCLMRKAVSRKTTRRNNRREKVLSEGEQRSMLTVMWKAHEKTGMGFRRERHASSSGHLRLVLEGANAGAETSGNGPSPLEAPEPRRPIRDWP
jgi:hypothetical protein